MGSAGAQNWKSSVGEHEPSGDVHRPLSIPTRCRIAGGRRCRAVERDGQRGPQGTLAWTRRRSCRSRRRRRSRRSRAPAAVTRQRVVAVLAVERVVAAWPDSVSSPGPPCNSSRPAARRAGRRHLGDGLALGDVEGVIRVAKVDPHPRGHRAVDLLRARCGAAAGTPVMSALRSGAKRIRPRGDLNLVGFTGAAVKPRVACERDRAGGAEPVKAAGPPWLRAWQGSTFVSCAPP